MTATLGQLIDAAVSTIDQHADELTALDQAIGDGDHGINMQRGFNAIAEIREQLIELTPAAALQKIGMTLVMKVGGASGPLYGSLFLGMGKALADEPSPTDLASALTAGVAMVKQRGKSDRGEKTLLDVLIPLAEAWQDGVSQNQPIAALLDELTSLADAQAQATIPMQASKGRASFLGERSIGHMDPGARSSALLIRALCQCLKKQLSTS